MAAKVRINSAGVRAVLGSKKVRSAVDSRAKRMASSLSGIQAHDGPVPVEVDSHTTDRAVAGVTLAHPGGIGLEAEHGFLTEAATAAGLQIGRRK